MRKRLSKRAQRRERDRRNLSGKSASLKGSKDLLMPKGILQSPKMIIPGETLTDQEVFQCSIHCRQCGECLREGKPESTRAFLLNWGSVFATASIVAAKVQRSKNCECFDPRQGKGAAFGVKVFAKKIGKFVNVIMKDPEKRDFTITKVEVIKRDA